MESAGRRASVEGKMMMLGMIMGRERRFATFKKEYLAEEAVEVNTES